MIDGAEPSAFGCPGIDLLQHLNMRSWFMLFDSDFQGNIQPLPVPGNQKSTVAARKIGGFGGLHGVFFDVFKVDSPINCEKVFHVQRAPENA